MAMRDLNADAAAVAKDIPDTRFDCLRGGWSKQEVSNGDVEKVLRQTIGGGKS